MHVCDYMQCTMESSHGACEYHICRQGCKKHNHVWAIRMMSSLLGELTSSSKNPRIGNLVIGKGDSTFSAVVLNPQTLRHMDSEIGCLSQMRLEREV